MTRGIAHKQSPRGLLRWFFRMPIWLYRFGLGRLLGERFLMLTHMWRKSRRLHMLAEVVPIVRCPASVDIEEPPDR